MNGIKVWPIVSVTVLSAISIFNALHYKSRNQKSCLNATQYC